MCNASSVIKILQPKKAQSVLFPNRMKNKQYTPKNTYKINSINYVYRLFSMGKF